MKNFWPGKCYEEIESDEKGLGADEKCQRNVLYWHNFTEYEMGKHEDDHIRNTGYLCLIKTNTGSMSYLFQ